MSTSRMARYVMMQQAREGGRNNGGEEREGKRTRKDYDGGMNDHYDDGHDTENRFRDRRGREHYDNGRYAPQNAYMPEYRGENDIEDRRGQRRGRDGRYRAEDGGSVRGAMRADYDDEDDDWHKEVRMNTIGFGRRDFPEPIWETPAAHYGADVEYGNMREMEQRKGHRVNGGAYGEEMQLTPELAEKWTRAMKNGDNTTGPHWSMEQTKQLAQQRNVTADPVEFYAIVNAMYSDYCEVAKKHNVHNTDFYVDLAKAWLNDKDAMPNKAAMYYACVVKHD